MRFFKYLKKFPFSYIPKILRSIKTLEYFPGNRKVEELQLCVPIKNTKNKVTNFFSDITHTIFFNGIKSVLNFSFGEQQTKRMLMTQTQFNTVEPCYLAALLVSSLITYHSNIFFFIRRDKLTKTTQNIAWFRHSFGNAAQTQTQNSNCFLEAFNTQDIQ